MFRSMSDSSYKSRLGIEHVNRDHIRIVLVPRLGEFFRVVNAKTDEWIRPVHRVSWTESERWSLRDACWRAEAG